MNSSDAFHEDIVNILPVTELKPQSQQPQRVLQRVDTGRQRYRLKETFDGRATKVRQLNLQQKLLHYTTTTMPTTPDTTVQPPEQHITN